MTYVEARNLIAAELMRAKDKFPGFPEDPIHAASILGEEAGEVIKAALQYTYQDGVKGDMIKEAVQTGAMAIRFLMNIENMTPIKSRQVSALFEEGK